MNGLLCAYCVATTANPANMVTALDTTGKRRNVYPHDVDRDWDSYEYAGQPLAWYAVTFVNGTALCGPHAAIRARALPRFTLT